MLTLKRLKVRGFRGFMSEQEFVFDSPVVFLFGENRRGKSSTLNAIEWCLFGEECRGTQTGIRERVDWEIPNRNMNPPDVLAELEFNGSEGFYLLRRTLTPRGRRGGLQEELKLTLPDGTERSGQQAKEHLSQLLRSSFRDFMTTVYQHQEAIRLVLTQEPRDRNDAMDRLLGLSDYRNLFVSIHAARVRDTQRNLSTQFDRFVQEVEVTLRTREEDLNEKRQKAIESGIAESDVNGPGGLRIAQEAVDSLTRFASETGMTPPGIKVPSKGLKEFQGVAKGEIDRMRAEMPDVKEQEGLFRRRHRFAELRTQYESKQRLDGEVLQKLHDFEKANGSEKEIQLKIEQTRKDVEDGKTKMRETSDRGALVQEAIKYLEKAGVHRPANRCPVCGGEATDLLTHLREEWEREIKIQVEQIKNRIDFLNREQRRLEITVEQQKKLTDQARIASRELQESRKEIERALQREIKETDDPSALLNKESQHIENRLRELGEAVRAKQQRLTAVERELQKVGLIVDLLELEEKKRMIEKIQDLPGYRELESLRDQTALFVEDIEKIKEAIGVASNEEARNKIALAGGMIDRYFRKLSDHPSVTGIHLNVKAEPRTGRNSYELTDQNGLDLTPVLSQGDLNVLALAIFLGLACSGGDAERFSFVMLDDPSQSLGSEHKRRLVEVLNDVLEQKRMILSTMDTELRDVLLSELTKAKTFYTFSDWTPTGGPQVQKG